MKKLLREFRDFIAKGNVLDLATGVIVGAAFGSIVNSLVNDVLSPLIGLVADTHLDKLVWKINGVEIGYGAFLTAVINFMLMALVLFFIVKAVARVHELGQKAFNRDADELAQAPATKECPFCKQDIAAAATRCSHCTSELTEA